MNVEVLGVKGLEKESDGVDIWWTAPENTEKFSVVARLGKRKREINFHKQTELKDEVLFFSDRVHLKYIDELADALERVGIEVDDVWIKEAYGYIELRPLRDGGKLWF